MTLVLTLLIFLAAGATLLAANLVAGRLVRPRKPNPDKGTVYDCGEEPIGPAWVQFDLRFYVVALLFVIFDVELAFLFPWAAVFGTSVQLADRNLSGIERREAVERLSPTTEANYPDRRWLDTWVEAEKSNGGPAEMSYGSGMGRVVEDANAAKSLAWIAFADLLVFFGVLLVGFAYLWRRGDLDWVRSVAGQPGESPPVATGGSGDSRNGRVREPV